MSVHLTSASTTHPHGSALLLAVDSPPAAQPSPPLPVHWFWGLLAIGVVLAGWLAYRVVARALRVRPAAPVPPRRATPSTPTVSPPTTLPLPSPPAPTARPAGSAPLSPLGRADIHRQRANQRLKKGDYQEAIQDLEQALALAPDQGVLYFERGLAYRRLHDYSRAIEDLTQAIRLAPDLAEAYYNRGLIRFKVKDYRRAVDDFSHALQLKPEFAEAYFNRNLARRKLGNYEGALADYQAALKLNPNYAYIHKEVTSRAEVTADDFYERGLVKAEKGNYAAALEEFDQALRMNPELAMAFYDRAKTRLALGNEAGGISDLRTAAALFKKNGDLERYQQVMAALRLRRC